MFSKMVIFFLLFSLAGCTAGHTFHPAQNVDLTPSVKLDQTSPINDNSFYVNHVALKAKYRF